MLIKEIILADIPDFRAVGTNATMLGFANFTLSKPKFSSKNQTVSAFLTAKSIQLNTDFQVNAKIIVPINEKGYLKIVTSNF